MLNEGRSPTQKKLQRTYSTQNKYLVKLCCFVRSKPAYYKYSLFEPNYNHKLFAYPVERRTKYVPFNTHASI